MEQPLVGQISLFAFNFAPRGWMTCEGQVLPISQNTALFSLIGNFYGGDGKTTFALPDLRLFTPKGLQYCIALQGVYGQHSAVGLAAVGEMALLPYSFAPQGWANCNGQLLPVADYETLFGILGKRFGGDGVETFGLPNLITAPPRNSPAPGSSIFFISLFGITDPPSALLGTVQSFPLDAAPDGWVACEGQLLPIAQYRPLFSLLGAKFGGDGTTTFGLPDLREYSPGSVLYCICARAPFPMSVQGPGGAEEGAEGTPPDETGSSPAEEGGD
ncbi:MAG TPA: tail fiber protein [Pyrinomonadaceae bacterium]|nr:tail fiber protein [Pyrinomonadaceae bacterium]